jgi:hypothetical protein
MPENIMALPTEAPSSFIGNFDELLILGMHNSRSRRGQYFFMV